MKNILIKGLFVSASVILFTSSVSAMTCTTLTKSLSKGSENSEVLKLQQFLFDGGYLTAKPNGYFGNGTLIAVKKFQKANGLAQVGSIGPGTRGKVKEMSCKDSGMVDSSSKQNVVSNSVIVSSSTDTAGTTLAKETGRRIIELPMNYQYFSNFFEINNKLGYHAYRKDSTSISGTPAVLYDGKEISSQYIPGSPVVINNKIAYFAQRKDASAKVIVYNQTEILPDKCIYVTSPVNIDNKLAFSCTKVIYDSHLEKTAGDAVIIVDGAEVSQSKNYYIGDSHFQPIDAGGKVAYQVVDRNDPFGGAKVLIDGVLDISLKKYSQIDYLNYVGGKLVFIGKKLYSEDPSTPSYLVYGGEEIAKDYSTIQSVAFVQGKSIVIATQDKGNVSKFVVFIDGVIKDLGYGAIYKVLEIGGKAAYSVKKGEKKFIVYDGKELGKEYDSAELPFVFNSKLAFFAKQGEKSFIVIEN